MEKKPPERISSNLPMLGIWKPEFIRWSVEAMDGNALKNLLNDLRNGSPEASSAARENLKKQAGIQDIPILLDLLYDDDVVVVESVASAIIQVNGIKYFPDLVKAIHKAMLAGHDCDSFQTELTDFIMINGIETKKILVSMSDNSQPDLEKTLQWLIEYSEG